MPGEIQTSFIPKTPVVTTAATPAPQQPSVGIVTVISLVLALTSVAIFVGATAYRIVLQQDIDAKNQQISDLKDNMPPERLKQIERLDTTLSNSKKLLDNHVSVSSVFNLLQSLTIPSVRYLSFNFAGNEVRLKGNARTYEDIAAQAEVLKNNKKTIPTFNFSDFTVDQKTKLVSFNLVLTVAREAFLYKTVASTTVPVRTATTTMATTTATTTANR